MGWTEIRVSSSPAVGLRPTPPHEWGGAKIRARTRLRVRFSPSVWLRQTPPYEWGGPYFAIYLVDFPVVGVDDVAFFLLFAGRRAVRWCTGWSRGPCALVDVLPDLLQGFIEVVHLALQVLGVRALGRALQRLELGVDLGLDVFRDPGLVVLDHLLGLADHVVRLVAKLDLFALGAVLGGVRLCLLDHPVDLVLVQGRGSRDRDGLLAASALVLRLDVEDAVGVEVEGDLDLGHAPRRGRDSVQVEAAKGPVVARHLPLALQDVDLDGRLVVRRGREDLGARGRDGRV